MRFCLLTLALAALPAAAAPLKVVVLGDSTVCDYPDKSPLRGWGQVLGRWFTDEVVITNLAASGRSTKTFIKEGRLDKALALKADYALIQFGHNDSHGAGRPEATDAATDFRDYLRTYIDEFRKVGTQPVLVSAMHRRLFGKDGAPTNELKPYAEAMRAVADERQVPLVDLWASSGDLLVKLGDEGSADLFNTPAKDRTHFVEKGALAMAQRVIEGLLKVCEPLAQRLRPAGDRPAAA